MERNKTTCRINDLLLNNSGDLIPVGTVFGTQIHSQPENIEGAYKQLVDVLIMSKLMKIPD
ncbi:hypothetical protein JHK82_027657 [Glycine max]|nr:hypothetical protein JHK82_027657 [Glycine max]